MKKILVSTLIAVMIGATLTGCGNKNSGNSSSVEQSTQQTNSVSAKEIVEKLNEKEYVRGSILDRNGNTIAFSQKPGGARTYSHPYAFSNLVGYWSKIYGTYGVEKT